MFNVINLWGDLAVYLVPCHLVWLHLYSVGNIHTRWCDKLPYHSLPECSCCKHLIIFCATQNVTTHSKLARSGPFYQIQLQSSSFRCNVRLYSLSHENILMACIVCCGLIQRIQSCNSYAAAMPMKGVLWAQVLHVLFHTSQVLIKLRFSKNIFF
jgi:hypothetical protein